MYEARDAELWPGLGIMQGRCYKIYTCCLGQPPALQAVTALLTPDKHQQRPGRSLGLALEAQTNRDNWPRESFRDDPIQASSKVTTTRWI